MTFIAPREREGNGGRQEAEEDDGHEHRPMKYVSCLA